MRFSLTNLGSPGWPLRAVWDAAARLGYEGIELRCFEGRSVQPDFPKTARDEVRRLVRDTGLPVIAVGATSVFSNPDPAVRAENEQILLGMLELAADVGAPTVRSWAGGFPGPIKEDAARAYGGGFPEGLDEASVCAYIADSVDRVAPRAEDLGITIVMETHDGLSSARVASRFFTYVRSPSVQVLWDVLHPTRMGERPEEVWSLLGPRVRHVHFKDAARDADGRWRATLFGQGQVPLRECLHVLRDHGYAQWVTLEWEKLWEPEIPEPEVAYPQMIQAARAWLQA